MIDPTIRPDDRTPMFARLPEPPAQADDQPTEHYAASLFCFVLATRCTATLEDEQLELAAHAGTRASAQASDPTMADAISAIRHLLALAIRQRHQTPAPEPQPAGQEPHTPNVGPMAPLLDRPITRPPAPSYAISADDIPF